MTKVIQVENIGKKYIIKHQSNERYLTLRDVLAKKLNGVFAKEKQNSNEEDFWALRDVSFEVNEGDRIGIIGRNGAGKSTLLKVLSKITEPTTGRIKIKGRVASLLEVGTGFHPELTGRENIYLNGAILGMTRVEIKKKFDEIVAFSEVEKFLDTPVKRYSSGMYVRLAFAVAAHLDPEILIVDEVLAVGDFYFRQKCMGKMSELQNTGRTLLFVSHDMSAVKTLCNKAIYFNKGSIIEQGACNDIVNFYLSSRQGMVDNLNPVCRDLSNNRFVGPKIIEVVIKDDGNNVRNKFNATESLIIDLKVQPVNNPQKNYSAQWSMYNDMGQLIAVGDSGYLNNIFYSLTKDNIKCRLQLNSLIPGKYCLRFLLYVRSLSKKEILDEWHDAISFEVTENDPCNIGFSYPAKNWPVQQYIDNRWVE